MIASENDTRRPFGPVDVVVKVLRNTQTFGRHWILSVQVPPRSSRPFSRFQPGQFVMLDLSHTAMPDYKHDLLDPNCPKDKHIILRRPFSPMDVRMDHGSIHMDLLYRVVGPATARMTTLRPDDGLRLLGPLGNGFRITNSKPVHLLVSGGTGLPPILHLATHISRLDGSKQIQLLLGVRTKAELPFAPDECNRIPHLEALGVPLWLTSDDGTIGQRGLITDVLERWLAEHKDLTSKQIALYACGPEPMLSLVAKIANQLGIDCQVSMEAYMACGIGVCQGCAIRVRSTDQGQAYQLCCRDGPVFDTRQLIFADHQ